MLLEGICTAFLLLPLLFFSFADSYSYLLVHSLSIILSLSSNLAPYPGCSLSHSLSPSLFFIPFLRKSYHRGFAAADSRHFSPPSLSLCNKEEKAKQKEEAKRSKEWKSGRHSRRPRTKAVAAAANDRIAQDRRLSLARLQQLLSFFLSPSNSSFQSFRTLPCRSIEVALTYTYTHSVPFSLSLSLIVTARPDHRPSSLSVRPAVVRSSPFIHRQRYFGFSIRESNWHPCTLWVAGSDTFSPSSPSLAIFDISTAVPPPPPLPQPRAASILFGGSPFLAIQSDSGVKAS